MRGTALVDHVACTGFALAALCRDTKFELNFVKSHAGTRVTRNFPVGHSAANANDHGLKALAGWLKCAIINTNSSHLQ
jgi:hypothetical protein